MSRHTVLGWALFFSGDFGPGEYDHFGFLGFSVIPHLAHRIVKFKRSCCKSFAAICTFRLKARFTVSLA